MNTKDKINKPVHILRKTKDRTLCGVAYGKDKSFLLSKEMSKYYKDNINITNLRIEVTCQRCLNTLNQINKRFMGR